MYDVMLDYSIHYPDEKAIEGVMEWKDIPFVQEGEWLSFWLAKEKVVVIRPQNKPSAILNGNPNPRFHEEMRVYQEAMEFNYIQPKKKTVRNLSSWYQHADGVLSFSTTDGGEWDRKVWKSLGKNRFLHIGTLISGDNGRSAATEYYADKILSVPLRNRFQDRDLKTMNIYVGETVNDLLSNFTLDIPQEQFVFPYPHGVSFVRKNFTTYLYENNGRIMWSYFGNDGQFRLNSIDLEDIISDGRISEKSIKSFYQGEVNRLNDNTNDFLHHHFEDRFGIKTEDAGTKCMSEGLITALTQASFGGEVVGHEGGTSHINMDGPHYPLLEDCWKIITEDLLKIICLNDRDFAKEKLKKTSKGKAISSKTNPKRIGRRYFKWGEDDIVYVYPTNSRSGAKLRRHIRRGHTKKQTIKYPENYGGKAFQMNDAWYVSKTIAPYWAGGKSTIPENQISPFCFGAIKMKYAGGSRIASQWIRKIEKKLGRKLIHNENGGKEYRIPYNDDNWFYIDAYDAETNTVYEFHGDYFHGNPTQYDPHDMNKTVKRTFGELHQATLQKQSILEDLGYTYVCIWESDFQSSP